MYITVNRFSCFPNINIELVVSSVIKFLIRFRCELKDLQDQDMAASLSSDILLPETVPNLDLPKHIEFLAKYGTVKDDYVRYPPTFQSKYLKVYSFLLSDSRSSV